MLFSNKGRRKVLKEGWVITVARASLLTLFVFGLFSYPMEIFQFEVVAVFFLALVSKYSPVIKYIRIGDPDFRDKPEITCPNALKIAIVAGWLAVALILITSMHDYANACKKWNAGLKGFSGTNNASSTKTLEAVYPRLKNNGIFLTTYGKTLNMSCQYSKAIAVLRRANCFLPSAANYTELGKSYRATGDFENAKTAWAKASCMFPLKFTPKYLMAKMCFENGKTAEAQQVARELLHKDIKIWSPGLQNILDELKELLKPVTKPK